MYFFVHVDICGPLLSSQGYRYLMTAMDRFTRWPEAVSFVDIVAVSTACAFVLGWISQFGILAFITTDRRSQFESTLVKELSHMLGCERIQTTAYNPSANGLGERFHSHLKASLKACMNLSGWVDALPLVLLGLLTAPLKQDLECNIAELDYGTKLRVPGKLFTPGLESLTSDPSNICCTTEVNNVGSEGCFTTHIVPSLTIHSCGPCDVPFCICHDAVRAP